MSFVVMNVCRLVITLGALFVIVPVYCAFMAMSRDADGNHYISLLELDRQLLYCTTGMVIALFAYITSA